MSVNFSNITDKTLNGNGWFDQFLTATRVQLSDARDKNEITQGMLGEILSSALPSMMAEAVKFELQRELADKQAAALDADILIKGKELELKDKEIDLKTQELVIRQEELAIKQAELDLKEREVIEKEKTGAKQRELIDEQIAEAQQKVLSAQREVDSYDDSLLIKITEMQGNVASFFLNSSPDTAETSTILADLKEMMQVISARADKVVGTQPAMPS